MLGTKDTKINSKFAVKRLRSGVQHTNVRV